MDWQITYIQREKKRILNACVCFGIRADVYSKQWVQPHPHKNRKTMIIAKLLPYLHPQNKSLRTHKASAPSLNFF